MRMASLTTAPQSGQKRTGAFARLWLKLGHSFRCVIILRYLPLYDCDLSESSVFLSLSFFSQMPLWLTSEPVLNLDSSYIPGLISSRCPKSWWVTWIRKLTIYWNTIIQSDCCGFCYLWQPSDMPRYFRSPVHTFARFLRYQNPHKLLAKTLIKALVYSPTISVGLHIS